jgi:hypothetical protein
MLTFANNHFFAASPEQPKQAPISADSNKTLSAFSLLILRDERAKE